MAFFRGDFYSEQLSMNTSVSVIIPDGVKNDETKVVYLLHGLSDNCTNWSRLSSVERYANEYKAAVVMPEVQRSFYADMKYGINYFSYVTKELPEFMHRMFNFKTDREHSYIAGLSMGGYGAMKSAFTYPEQYEACAAFSSACDMQFNIDKRYISGQMINECIAIFGEDLKIGEENDLFELLKKADKSEVKPRLMMTCGTLDSLLEQNHRLRDEIQKTSFCYKYEEWEDDHTWRFWDASIQLAFDFFFDNGEGTEE